MAYVLLSREILSTSLLLSQLNQSPFVIGEVFLSDPVFNPVSVFEIYLFSGKYEKTNLVMGMKDNEA